MKRKIIGLFICILLIVTSAYSATGNKIVDKNERSPCGLDNAEENHENEVLLHKNIILKNDKGEPFYAYNAFDPTGILDEGPVYFYPDNPGNITQIAPTTSTDFISGSTWTKDNEWYGCEWGMLGNRNIWTINSTTGKMTLVGSYGANLSFNGLAYDNTSGTLYGCNDTALYTVDMETGNSSLVGAFGLIGLHNMTGIAFDDKGNLYGDEIQNDSLYKINTSTGIATLIGPLGINLQYAQDMAYDIDNGILYLSAYTIAPVQEGALYTCNITNGHATKVDSFQGGAQITGFAIPYESGGGPPPQDETPPKTNHTSNPSEPNGDYGWFVSAVKVTISATDDDSGVAWTNYSLNDGISWVTHYGPDPFYFVVGEGEHKMLYYSVDNVGNVETLKGPFDLKIDTVRPDKRWYMLYVLRGPEVVAIISYGAVRDGLSGVDRVEFYLNDTFHHKMDLSVWPVGRWCPIFWLHTNPSPGDKCGGIVYDKAGNWKEIKPQTVPNNINDVSYRQR